MTTETDRIIPEEINEKDRISILLEEYKSLRAEILQRNTILNNFLIVSTTATVTLFVYVVLVKPFWGFVLLSILACAIFVFFQTC